jgi:hypothetical protein
MNAATTTPTISSAANIEIPAHSARPDARALTVAVVLPISPISHLVAGGAAGRPVVARRDPQTFTRAPSAAADARIASSTRMSASPSANVGGGTGLDGAPPVTPARNASARPV